MQIFKGHVDRNVVHPRFEFIVEPILGGSLVMEENTWKHELSYSAIPCGAASTTEIEMVCVMIGEETLHKYQYDEKLYRGATCK